MNAVPIIPWIGGKRRLADKILPLFPPHQCYVEAFAGAAAMFFMKEPAKAEILNDINGELVNLYRVVQYHLDEFVRQFRWSLSSRKIFTWLKITDPLTLTDIQRAARFYYLQRQSFGAKVVGQSFGVSTHGAPRLNLLRIEEELSAAHLRLSNATIENLGWMTCLERYDRPHTLFYLDPPYWGTEGYGVPFELAEYAAMAESIRKLKGKAIVSVNDIPEMREAFEGFRVQAVQARNTLSGSRQTLRSEIIILSWN